MPNSFEKREARVKFMLELFEESIQLHRKDVQVKWIKADLPACSFDKMFYWVRNRGYIKKVDPNVFRSAYEITESGKKYLNGLRA